MSDSFKVGWLTAKDKLVRAVKDLTAGRKTSDEDAARIETLQDDKEVLKLGR